jgi:4-amino-4-deoxy-L-arabinose transferase-like glycosyltransferase
MSGYLSRKHPFYFYLTILWSEFAPSSVLLPLAIFMAWKTRKEWENRAWIFFFSLSLGPIIFLSASVAKDYVYLLPVHPALAMLAAWAIIKGWTLSERVVKVLRRILAIAAVLAAGAMLGLTAILGGTTLSMTVAMVVFAFATGGSFFSIRGHDLRWTNVFIALLIALGWSRWFTGPMAQADVARRSMHQTMGQVLNLVGDRDVLLYHPTDGLRGEASFYRNRTAQELTSAEGLVSQLAGNPNKVVALIFSPREEVLPVELSKISQAMETHLQIEACFDFGNKYLHIVSGQAFGQQANDSRR